MIRSVAYLFLKTLLEQEYCQSKFMGGIMKNHYHLAGLNIVFKTFVEGGVIGQGLCG